MGGVKARVTAQDTSKLVNLAADLLRSPSPLPEAMRRVLDEVERFLGWSGGRIAPADTAEADGRLLLRIRAEGTPVAALEFRPTNVAAEHPAVRSVLDLLAAQLSALAGRERMQEAVRRAAAHSRPRQASASAAATETKEPSLLYNLATGLPDQPLLEDRVRQAIRRRQRSPRNKFAVIVVTLQDDGRSSGRPSPSDQLPVEARRAVARRLAAHCRPADTVAHRGDDFVVVLDSVRTVEEAMEVAERMAREARRRFTIGPAHVSLEAFVGVVLGSAAYDEPGPLLDDADAAVARARTGPDRVQLFDTALQESDKRRRLLEAELGNALAHREFHLEYQPIVALTDGRITGLEALLRWRHPEMGLVPPNEFVPVAACSPLILDIGNWVLEETCVQIRRWQDRLAPRTVPPVAVNITGRQLFHEEFLGRVRDILEQHAIAPRQIRFDVPEGDLMQDGSRAAEVLDRLQGMGIRVAVDDFGTGFSSLSLLHALPIGALKIDRSFVSRPRERLRKWCVARTIVELAKILDVEVIAEGIETREQFRELRDAGCHQAQGFYFGGAVGPAQAEELIRGGYPLDLETAVS